MRIADVTRKENKWMGINLIIDKGRSEEKVWAFQVEMTLSTCAWKMH